MKYAEVILPLPVEGTFTYLVPEKSVNIIAPGFRVVVSFGEKKIYTGIVHSIHELVPDYNPKKILDVLDADAIINAHQLTFFEWIARYYMCTLGEVINAALPTALKLSSESFVGINPSVNPDVADVNDSERELLRLLQSNSLSIKNVGEVLNLKQPQRILKNLSIKGYIDLYEKIKDKYRPRIIKKIRVHTTYQKAEMIEAIINELESKPKQQDVLISYLKEVPILETPEANTEGLSKTSLLMDDISPSSLKTLVKKGILEEFEEKTSHLRHSFRLRNKPISLSPAQEKARQNIESTLEHQSITLLHGITGSGKTELYIELIRKQVKAGKQVLYLLPEIALTTQIIARLYEFFGDTFGVYHSKYSDNERAEVWEKVRAKEYPFVVGVRSAIFLPFNELGMIIIDEEHEPSFKQNEPAPRYHARDSAIYLSTLHKAKVLMGTATPSLESYKNALDGKFGLVELSERYGKAYQPKIMFANTLKEKKQNKLKGNFTSRLIEEITLALCRKEQAIIFQNRRGYASHVSCDHCASVPKCPNCAVSLTYHQYNNKLVCHYCGHNQAMLIDCLHCGSKELTLVGFGTEELEEELEILFPNAIIQRMDLDTTRSKYGYQRIIEAFEEGSIDILVGTQMVSKGLDFDRVNLVGVFDTDRMIHFPSFRSHERAFQLITQVSGRAGRKSKDGVVVIQTSDPDQPLLKQIESRDYQAFYQREMMEREHFHYPPFTRIIHINFKYRDKRTTFQAANFYYHEIRKRLPNLRILGPAKPIIGKIRNQYLYELTLKFDKQGVNLPVAKEYLKSVRIMMLGVPAFKRVGIFFNVDPVQ